MGPRKHKPQECAWEAPPPPKEKQERANPTQGAYDVMGAGNRRALNTEGRGPRQVSGSDSYFTGRHGAAQTQAPGVCLGATEQHAEGAPRAEIH